MLLVIRGSANKVDPTYRCVSNNDNVGNYSIIEMSESGKVEKKLSLPLKERKSVENLMSSYRAVFVDKRENTIPLTVPTHAKDASEILHIIRRQKSEEEKRELANLSLLTQEGLQGGEQKFRGSANKNKNKCFYQEEDRGNFIQYRSGLQSSKGLCSDVAMCVGKNDHAHLYLTGLYRAIEKVQPHVTPGANFESLEKMLQDNVPSGVKIIGSSFNHIGYERVDPIQVSGEIQPHDVINMNVTFRGTDGKDSTIHGGVFSFPEETHRSTMGPGSASGALDFDVDDREDEDGTVMERDTEQNEGKKMITKAADDLGAIADAARRFTMTSRSPDAETKPPPRSFSLAKRALPGRFGVKTPERQSRATAHSNREGFDESMAPRIEAARNRRVERGEPESEYPSIDEEQAESILLEYCKDLLSTFRTLFANLDDLSEDEAKRRIARYNSQVKRKRASVNSKRIDLPEFMVEIVEASPDGIEAVHNLLKTCEEEEDVREEEVEEEEVGEEY